MGTEFNNRGNTVKKALLIISALFAGSAMAAELADPITSCSLGSRRGNKVENMPLVVGLSVDSSGVWSVLTDVGMPVRFRAFQATLKGGAKTLSDIRVGQSRIVFNTAVDSFGTTVIPGGAFDTDGFCSIVPEVLVGTGWMNLDGSPANGSLPTGVTLYKK